MPFQELTEEDAQQLAEDEYYRLESKFMFSEIQGTYSTKIKAALRQQERILDVLGKEQYQIKTDIAVTNSVVYKEKEQKGLSTIYNYIENEKQLDDEIMTEKSEIKDINVEIDKVKKEIIELNRTEVHASNITEAFFKSEQKIRQLEDKLEHATTRFGNMLTKNAEYRKEIDILLNERKTFYKNYMTLYRRLQHGKQIMLDLVEQATTTYDQREEAITKLNSLKQKTAAEKKIQSVDVQDLKRKLEIAEDLLTFLSIKGQKRVSADLVAREARDKKTQRVEMEAKINKYSKILNKITDLSEEEDVDKFMVRFVKSEEENMGLFNYVNEVNDEVEILQAQVTSLLDRIDDQKLLNEKRSTDQLDLIQCLEQSVANKREQYVGKCDNFQTSKALLNELFVKIERMLLEFECDNTPVIALLGNNAHVNPYNVILCLGLLESQLFDFIYITYAKENSVQRETILQGCIVQEDSHMIAAKRPVVYHLVSTSPCPLCVETDRIFILDENNEDDTLEEYEFVHEQLLSKLDEQDMDKVLHNISACRLPRSRAIMQARFQEES